TQIRNPCFDPQCNNCPSGASDFVAPIARADAYYIQECPRGPWPNPLPARSSTIGALGQFDNFYKSSDSPPQYLPVGCPKKGFKNVYATKQWHGTFGPMSDVPTPGLSSMKGNCDCQV